MITKLTVNLGNDQRDASLSRYSSEASLACYLLTRGNSSAAGGGIRGSSAGSTSGHLSNSTTTITFNTTTAGCSHSQLEYETRQEGLLPYNLELELTLYESIVSMSAQQYALEVEETGYSRSESQTQGATSDSGTGYLAVPAVMGPAYYYESNERFSTGAQTVTIATETARSGVKAVAAEQFSTSSGCHCFGTP